MAKKRGNPEIAAHNRRQADADAIRTWQQVEELPADHIDGDPWAKPTALARLMNDSDILPPSGSKWHKTTVRRLRERVERIKAAVDKDGRIRLRMIHPREGQNVGDVVPWPPFVAADLVASGAGELAGDDATKAEDDNPGAGIAATDQVKNDQVDDNRPELVEPLVVEIPPELVRWLELGEEREGLARTVVEILRFYQEEMDAFHSQKRDKEPVNRLLYTDVRRILGDPGWWSTAKMKVCHLVGREPDDGELEAITWCGRTPTTFKAHNESWELRPLCSRCLSRLVDTYPHHRLPIAEIAAHKEGGFALGGERKGLYRLDGINVVDGLEVEWMTPESWPRWRQGRFAVTSSGVLLRSEDNAVSLPPAVWFR